MAESAARTSSVPLRRTAHDRVAARTSSVACRRTLSDRTSNGGGGCRPRFAGSMSPVRVTSRQMDFRLLGPLEVLTDQGAAEVGTGKRAALLTYLLINANEVVSAERLIDELWGEHPPATAAKSVQVYVSQLRKALNGNGSLLMTRGSGYVLAVDEQELDIKRFECAESEAERALEAGDAKQAARLAAEALA